jgi:hypothetical protein
MKKFAPHSFPSNIQRLLWPTNVLTKWRLSFINSMMELRNMTELEGETATEYSLPHTSTSPLHTTAKNKDEPGQLKLADTGNL